MKGRQTSYLRVGRPAAIVAFALVLACMALFASACNGGTEPSSQNEATVLEVNDIPLDADAGGATPEAGEGSQSDADSTADAEALRAELSITEDYRTSFIHGSKTAEYQKYIVLHDTEGEGDGESVVNYWDGNGSGVAAHFIVNKDGTIVQCVALDNIAHHAGYGDTGHNDSFGITEDGRDDMVGTSPIGSWASDYGMNAWSIGIEMVHVGGSGSYPEAQLEALDKLIAYINAYYGFDSEIIDHKEWRSGNSDTSAEFAGYLANYKEHNLHI